MGFFYVDENKLILNETFLTDKAKNWAKLFLSPETPRERWMSNPKLNSAQLRKFHIEAKDLEERVKNLENPEKQFERIRPLVKMLKSKVAYACPSTGKDRKVPVEFRRYIEEMVDNVNDIRDFEAFSLCFEAVVGFFYGEGGR